MPEKELSLKIQLEQLKIRRLEMKQQTVNANEWHNSKNGYKTRWYSGSNKKGSYKQNKDEWAWRKNSEQGWTAGQGWSGDQELECCRQNDGAN